MSQQTAIIEAATSSGTATLEVRNKRALITCDDLGAETITVQVLAGDYVDLFSAGNQQQLTAANNALYLPAPGNYRIAKPPTAGAVGVYTLQD